MHFISCIRCCWFAQQEIMFSYFSLCSYLSRKWRKAAVDSTDNQAWICNRMCPCFSINHEIKFFSSKLKFWKEISESSTQVFSASLKDFILFSMPSSWNWHGSASGVFLRGLFLHPVVVLCYYTMLLWRVLKSILQWALVIFTCTL